MALKLPINFDGGAGRKYRIDEKAGRGKVYIGVNLTTKKKVAIKIEPQNVKSPSLVLEHNFLKQIGNKVGFPRVHDFVAHNGHNALVIDFLGKDIETKFQELNSSFPLKTILMIGLQMTERMEYLHSKGILYRNVKPEHFLLGASPETSNVIYVVDLGLAKFFRNETGHIPQAAKPTVTGTPRYISINVHNLSESSRRDDIESVAYVLFYFLLKGHLPWQGLPSTGNVAQNYKEIGKMKAQTSPEALASQATAANPGFGDLKCFADYLRHARGLGFTQVPKYKYLKSLFVDYMTANGIVNDGKFEWTNNPGGGQPRKVEATPTNETLR